MASQNLDRLFFLLDEDEDYVKYRNERRKIPRIQDRPNHFAVWNDNEFFSRFRLSKITVSRIIQEIEGRIAFPTNRIVLNSFSDDLLRLDNKLKRAECESDLNTDEEGSLKRKRKQKQYSSSDENDDNGVTIKNRLSTQIPSPPPPTSNQGNTSTDLEKHVIY
ncbi:hypothetical protein FQA39_LY12690 [Lamprigera yunnana]|nr:hypothetical protein FQA39_LY12690 [Lamprigera yunnana]